MFSACVQEHSCQHGSLRDGATTLRAQAFPPEISGSSFNDGKPIPERESPPLGKQCRAITASLRSAGTCILHTL